MWTLWASAHCLMLCLAECLYTTPYSDAEKTQKRDHQHQSPRLKISINHENGWCFFFSAASPGANNHGRLKIRASSISLGALFLYGVAALKIFTKNPTKKSRMQISNLHTCFFGCKMSDVRRRASYFCTAVAPVAASTLPRLAPDLALAFWAAGLGCTGLSAFWAAVLLFTVAV